MATTTNYGWTTPDDTALVKDGASAIRTLGTSIDTTTFNNASAAIAKTIVDAKGDIIVATAADTVSRLAVGANDTVLVADSAQATGVKWATPSSGGMTLITTTTFNNTATSYTYSSLGSYKHLMILLENASFTGSGVTTLGVRFNSDAGANYMDYNVGGSSNAFNANSSVGASLIQLMYNALSGNGQTTFRNGNGQAWIYDYSGAQVKNTSSQCKSGNQTDQRIYQIQGTWNNTDAITSVTLLTTNVTNFNSGTLKLYGVS